MEIDKLNRAMEEASPISSPKSERMFKDGFKQGAEWLMGQPLKDRMDEEEWEEYIKLKRYANYVYHWGNSPVECKKCGNLNPSGYICASCGWDNSYEPNEDE